MATEYDSACFYLMTSGSSQYCVLHSSLVKRQLVVVSVVYDLDGCNDVY